MALGRSRWVYLAFVALGACGGDDTVTGDGGSDATTDVTQKDATPDTTVDATVDATSDVVGADAPTDGGTDAADGAIIALDCNTYCTTITTLCTGGSTQYIDKATCLAMCAKIPSDGGADASSGNSLQCRGHFLALAATDAGANCAHAGAYGFGACGSVCNDFCGLYGARCDIDGGWGGFSACVSECGQIPGATDPNGPWTDGGPPDKYSPDMPCREYRLESAYGEGGIPECDTTSQFPQTGCVQL